MAINVPLGGIFISQAGQLVQLKGIVAEACDPLTAINASNICKYNGDDIVGSINDCKERLNAVLRAIDQNNLTDGAGKAIDLRTQINVLVLLIDLTRDVEMVVRDFLTSEKGQIKWNNGNVQFWGTRTVNIADECTSLTTLANRMQDVLAQLRRPIDIQNATLIRPFVETVFFDDLIGIIGQYMDN